MPTTVSREHGGHRLRPHRRQQLRAGRPAGRPWVASAWSLWICEAICKHELGTTCTKTLQGRMIALGMGSNALQAGVAIEHAACGRSAAVRTMQQTVRLWRCGLLLGSISRCQTTVRHRVGMQPVWVVTRFSRTYEPTRRSCDFRGRRCCTPMRRHHCQARMDALHRLGGDAISDNCSGRNAWRLCRLYGCQAGRQILCNPALCRLLFIESNQD